MNEPDLIQSLLMDPTSIAVVGLSENPARPSNYVSAYMLQHGFTIYPINPALDEVLGQRCYPSLSALVDAGVTPHIVNVFRTPNFVPGIVDEMLSLSLRNLWVQQGIVNKAAAEAAERGGIRVVMDRCIMVEHRTPCSPSGT